MLLKSFAYKGSSASSLTISPQAQTHLFLSSAHHCSEQNCSFWGQVCCMRGRQSEHWTDIHRLPILGHQKDRQKTASQCLVESGESGVYWVLTLACDTSHSAQPYKEPGRPYLQSSFIISCNCHHKFHSQGLNVFAGILHPWPWHQMVSPTPPSPSPNAFFSSPFPEHWCSQDSCHLSASSWPPSRMAAAYLFCPMPPPALSTSHRYMSIDASWTHLHPSESWGRPISNWGPHHLFRVCVGWNYFCNTCILFVKLASFLEGRLGFSTHTTHDMYGVMVEWCLCILGSSRVF